jgi:hypothetical protein
MKKEKSQVNYRRGTRSESCKSCRYFEVKGPERCLKVLGRIEPQMLCDLYEPKGQSAPVLRS